jgi:pimeloyl-ACP methyl ester carboxylesterase
MTKTLIVSAILLLVLVLALLKLANRGLIPVGRSSFDVKADYLGSPTPHKKRVVVVFVHGIFGDKKDSWSNQQSSFPQLLKTDPEFGKQTDIFLFEYFTPYFGSAASIPALASQLRGSLEDHRVFEDHQNVIFVSHSMGGLVVRQYLLVKHNLAKVALLYFYATPTNGSELTKSAQNISSNPQLRGILPLEGNDLLQSINDGWLNWTDTRSVPSHCAFELLPTDGVWVVSQSSAEALCNQPSDPMTADHITIVKPADRDDPRYSRLATAMRESLLKTEGSAPKQNAPAGTRQKADVTFKFEGLDSPSFYLFNISKTETARDPKYAFGLWDLDSVEIKNPLPIPVHTATGDFILPDGLMGPSGIMSESESIRRRGHRLFGFASSLCSNCAFQHDYWISFKLGVGGWYAPKLRSPKMNLPEFAVYLSQSSDVPETLVPPSTRHPIP